LLDIPGDARWKGQYINKNNRVVRNILIETAKEMHCSYWDFYEIMGGENSIDAWYNHDLAAEDKLHLAPEGYRLKADLFFDAFKKLFEGQFNTYITERE
jgi:lysophospholipase L1-like esterase